MALDELSYLRRLAALQSNVIEAQVRSIAALDALMEFYRPQREPLRLVRGGRAGGKANEGGD
jgi:hypothetical protein